MCLLPFSASLPCSFPCFPSRPCVPSFPVSSQVEANTLRGSLSNAVGVRARAATRSHVQPSGGVGTGGVHAGSDGRAGVAAGGESSLYHRTVLLSVLVAKYAPEI